MGGGRAVGFEPGCGLVSMPQRPRILEGEEVADFGWVRGGRMRKWAVREELVRVDWVGTNWAMGEASRRCDRVAVCWRRLRRMCGESSG